MVWWFATIASCIHRGAKPLSISHFDPLLLQVKATPERKKLLLFFRPHNLIFPSFLKSRYDNYHAISSLCFGHEHSKKSDGRTVKRHYGHCTMCVGVASLLAYQPHLTQLQFSHEVKNVVVVVGWRRLFCDKNLYRSGMWRQAVAVRRRETVQSP